MADIPISFHRGVYSFVKERDVGVHHRECHFCLAMTGEPGPVDLAEAIRTGRNFVSPFGSESGDFWPYGWVEVRRGQAGEPFVMCPACVAVRLGAAP